MIAMPESGHRDVGHRISCQVATSANGSGGFAGFGGALVGFVSLDKPLIILNPTEHYTRLYTTTL